MKINAYTHHQLQTFLKGSFLKQIYQIFGKTSTSPFSQIILEVLVKVNFPLYCDIHEKHHNLSNIIEPQIKRLSILKENSMKIVCPLLFQLSSLQTLASRKNYVSIFPSLIRRFSGVGFLKQVFQIFGKTRTSPFFQIIL